MHHITRCPKHALTAAHCSTAHGFAGVVARLSRRIVGWVLNTLAVPSATLWNRGLGNV